MPNVVRWCQKTSANADFFHTADVKTLHVSFPDGRADETWRISDQSFLASQLRGGALAPVAAPNERLMSIKVLDSGSYVFVSPEAALDVPMLHDVTLAFDLMGDGLAEPLTFDKISAWHLDDTLGRVEALGLAETMEDGRMRRHVKREFSALHSGRKYWLVPLAEETLRSQARLRHVLLCCH